MTRWQQERASVRLRNGAVTAVAGRVATVDLDGASIPNVPIHGPVPAVGARVMLMEQGSSLVILGDAVSLQTEVRALREEVSLLRDLYENLKRRAAH